MSSIFLTSEDISNGRISDNAVRNHQWIRQNLHLLDEDRLNHWNSINRLKEWNLTEEGGELYVTNPPVIQVSSNEENTEPSNKFEVPDDL